MLVSGQSVLECHAFGICPPCPPTMSYPHRSTPEALTPSLETSGFIKHPLNFKLVEGPWLTCLRCLQVHGYVHKSPSKDAILSPRFCKPMKSEVPSRATKSQHMICRSVISRSHQFHCARRGCVGVWVWAGHGT